MALIDAVGPIAQVIGDGPADESAQDEPMDVPDNGIENIFSRKGIGIFLLMEGKVVVLLGIGKHTIG